MTFIAHLESPPAQWRQFFGFVSESKNIYLYSVVTPLLNQFKNNGLCFCLYVLIIWHTDCYI